MSKGEHLFPILTVILLIVISVVTYTYTHCYKFSRIDSAN